jgi:hypothetical protein
MPHAGRIELPSQPFRSSSVVEMLWVRVPTTSIRGSRIYEKNHTPSSSLNKRGIVRAWQHGVVSLAVLRPRRDAIGILELVAVHQVHKHHLHAVRGGGNSRDRRAGRFSAIK